MHLKFIRWQFVSLSLLELRIGNLSEVSGLDKLFFVFTFYPNLAERNLSKYYFKQGKL